MTHEPIESQEDDDARVEVVKRTKNEIMELEKSFDIWGHGVETKDVALSIMLDGFVTSWGTLISFAYQFPSYSDGIKRMVGGWDYHGREFKMIFAIPKGMWSSETDHKLATSETQRFLYDQVQENDSMSSLGKYRIGSDKIIGYINDMGELVRNESFDGDKLKQDYLKKGAVVVKEEE